MRHWFFLAVAIAAEVAGTSFMKWSSVHGHLGGLAAMFILLGASYYALSLAVIRVPVGLAYAVWEGVGLVAITLVSLAWFGESLGPMKAAGIAAVLGGILLIKRGMTPAADDAAVPVLAAAR
ncbi:MAG: QacE family quaternary ammonium compound efflux SMR transporter [Alcaligenaceae bacterium]|nr:QacE family quaternary ammonium compound efflux SMR transporter [Alcaligenaceae bacterium SAGV5]MPS54119.1 QacE family quaternary ammonium compound efflux SMR transporter [Alcaligenaceae bacterium SAGV3]MPT58818.1 QacE family quaternary ammonium compound efflux SMR transporter [Alcaligenaceae bacterium]